MNKILIIGCSGSGKSHFARELNKITNIPIYYLDTIFWKENWDHLSKEELLNEINKIVIKDKWIIDGNYTSSLEERIKFCDTVFFLDIDESICLKSEELRRGTKRDDLPYDLYKTEVYDPEFIDFIKEFKNKQKPIILKLLDKYKDGKTIITFKSRDDVNNYISNYVK